MIKPKPRRPGAQPGNQNGLGPRRKAAKVAISLRLPVDLRAALVRLAGSRGITVTALTEEILRSGVASERGAGA